MYVCVDDVRKYSSGADVGRALLSSVGKLFDGLIYRNSVKVVYRFALVYVRFNSCLSRAFKRSYLGPCRRAEKLLNSIKAII